MFLLALIGFSGGLETGATWGPFGGTQDDVTAYLNSSERKAVEAFAVARTINAAVSFLKSADLSAVVAQVAPLEVLEPVDDLAKQFSDVMVVSIVSMQLQRLVLAVSQAWALTIVFPIGCLLLAASFGAYRSPSVGPRLAGLGRSLILLSLFARFAVLAAGLVGTTVTDDFLTSDLDKSMSVMSKSGGSLDRFSAQVSPSEVSADTSQEPATADAGNGAAPSVLDQLTHAVRTTAHTTRQVINRGEALVNEASAWIPDKAALESAINGLPGEIVRAMEIFLVQTILTPLAVAWFFYAMLKGAIRPVPMTLAEPAVAYRACVVNRQPDAKKPPQTLPASGFRHLVRSSGSHPVPPGHPSKAYLFPHPSACFKYPSGVSREAARGRQ